MEKKPLKYSTTELENKLIETEKDLKAYMLHISDPEAQYRCYVCGFSTVIETREGYTCRNCGSVLDKQRLEIND